MDASGRVQEKGDTYMKRLIPICSVLAAVLFFATIAAAQTTSVSGQILGPDGNPFVGAEIKIVSTDTGMSMTTKTDKHGLFTQVGLYPGQYKITVHDPTGKVQDYTVARKLEGGADNDTSIDLKKIIAAAPANPEAQKKQQEANLKFTGMKGHYDAGVAAMNDARTLRAQLDSAPNDQRGPIQGKLATDYSTAITELQQAQQAAAPTETKNQALILNVLGEAYDFSGQYSDAVDAYQKAIAFNPVAGVYMNLSMAQSHLATSQTDPKAVAQAIADASSSCDKAAALDPTTAASCWRILGGNLSNKGDMKDAIVPLQKATQANPKDAEMWYTLGSALLATAETKQQGNQTITIFPPGTADAFQKCIDADPNGPYASQAKDVLTEMASMNPK
jgi:tetratricopeptide (TPR) repeat protein